MMLPKFDLDYKTIKNDLILLLKKNLDQVDKILQGKTYTWENLMQPLDELAAKLEKFWAPISHINSVCNSEEIRNVYDQCLPLLTDYSTTMGHNFKLFQAIESLAQLNLNNVQKKIISDALLDFKLSGVTLDDKKKARFQEIEQQLAELSNKFSNNIIDSTKAQDFHILDPKDLEGLPQHTIDTAKSLAAKKNIDGWLLTLESPCYIAVMTYAKNHNLRKLMYDAYSTRASDQGEFGSHHPELDNTNLMIQILNLRHEKSQLLGYANYAEFSLATKMANSPSKVMNFLEELCEKSYLSAQNDLTELENFVSNKKQIMVWDLAFYSEQLKDSRYKISNEMLRPFFPLSRVMEGLSDLIYNLFSVKLESMEISDVWHKDVRCLGVIKNGKLLGYIYCDLFARPNKRTGAWMDTLQSYFINSKGEIELPIATLTCNFTQTLNVAEPLLSHDEVETLFHEMGHVLHHVLTQVEYYSASGIQGVEWDAVELPSQFLENWCWNEKILKNISFHYETHESLPDDMINLLIKSRKFQAGFSMLRQLQFAIFDFKLHSKSCKNHDFIRNTINEVRQKTSVVKTPDYNRFENSFSHIFAGGYAAGYYSYKWAEVLSCDIYEHFLANIDNVSQIGEQFLREILSRGSSRTTSENFREFMGREPEVTALLKQYDLH